MNSPEHQSCFASTPPALRVLVTNDDGAASPLLHAFLEALSRQSWCAQLRPVVPRDEQSWVAQAITRFRPLAVQSQTVAGIPAHVVDGTPADCASLGITELFSERPDLLLSGINFGTNENLAFYLNSGTVGGARQGIVFGCPGIALSVKLPLEVFALWRADNVAALVPYQEDWKRIAETCCAIIGKLLDGKCWRGVDLYAVNLPWQCTPETEVKLTRLERVRYPSIFHSFQDGHFQHNLRELIREPRSEKSQAEEIPADGHAVDDGYISVAPIVYDLFPRDEELLNDLLSRFSVR